jgi:hypothetical protein
MTRKHTFPAGEYYIGDPCYVIPDDDWMKAWEATCAWGAADGTPTDFDDGIFHWIGRTCFAAYTVHGDGSYGNRKGSTIISVDSGLIGIIPFKKGDEIEGLFYPYTMLRTFGKKFEVWEEDGIFHFGNKVKINTN